jgi:hypothetical protein
VTADAHKRVPTGIVPNWPARSGRAQARPYRDRPQLARAQRTRTSASLPGTVPNWPARSECAQARPYRGSSPTGLRAADAHKRVPTRDHAPNWPASSGRAQARPYQRSCPQLAREQRTRTSASLPGSSPIGPCAADAHKRVPTGIVPNWPVRSGRAQARPYRGPSPCKKRNRLAYTRRSLCRIRLCDCCLCAPLEQNNPRQDEQHWEEQRCV